jgi:hypothetical protein
MQVISRIKSMFTKRVTVEEVHREFLTASEKLVSEANQLLANCSVEKSNRLSKMGFSRTGEVVASAEAVRMERLVKVIQKYAISHPNNKVITDDQIKTICNKYGLIMGSVDRFKGFVPEKNLRDMESFKVPTEKEYPVPDEPQQPFIPGKSSLSDLIRGFRIPSSLIYSDFIRSEFSPAKDSFSICAPQKDMHINSWERVEDNKIVHVPDPVVLYPIENNCYLIVTAWGDEASDPIVVNQKMN